MSHSCKLVNAEVKVCVDVTVLRQVGYVKVEVVQLI